MKKAILAALLCLTCLSASAQEEVLYSVSEQRHLPLPWGLNNLTILDSNLYAAADGFLLCSPIDDGTILALQPDTSFRHYEVLPDYILRRPNDQRFYFTIANPRGTKRLYRHVRDEGHQHKRVDLKGWKNDIYHPTFSADGNMMVFSSMAKVGLGGYDLWCSFWNGKHWTKPINLGSAINSAGNETTPTFYGNYLIYASNGIEPNLGTRLYSVYMKPGTNTEDILFSVYKPQPLPPDINRLGDNRDFAYDTNTRHGYWISSTNGKSSLYQLNGQLGGAHLTGMARNNYGEPEPGVTVAAMYRGRIIASCTVGNDGYYNLFLRGGRTYDLRFSKSGFFTVTIKADTPCDDPKQLFNVYTANVTMETFPIGMPIAFKDAYSRGTDIELSESGMSSLMTVVEFLRDNPQLHADLTLYCDQSTDSAFNNLVIEHRINALQQTIQTALSSTERISLQNGNNEGENVASGSGKNEIFVLIH